ncbi:hypothetical protein BG000_006561 [Podila horticola]|nr:hypothetical protein BG000_006561 [Podila horticola]
MTVRAPEVAQPQTKSREVAFLKGAMEAIESEVTDEDITPRPAYKTIGLKSSSETLKANNVKPSFDLKAQYTPAAPSSATASSRSSTIASSKANGDKLAMTALTPVEPSPSPSPSTLRNKFSISRKKKRLQKQAQELEEQRLKDEANEALRRKHGEYHPPGHTPGLIHNHRPPQHHDHQQIERSRSLTNMRQQYQQQPSMHRYPSTSRVASPTSFHSPSSPTSPRSHTSSASSSTYSSRHNSYTNGHNPRPTSPMREHKSVQIDLSQVNPHLNDLEGLDEGILSEYWDSNSEDDHDLSFDRSGYQNRSKRSMDSTSESSYQTDQSSINPPSALTRQHSRANRSTLSIDTRSLPTHSNHHPSISQQIQGDPRFSDYRSDSRLSNYRRGDSRLSNYPEDHDHSVVEMAEVKSPPSVHPHDQSRHQSWPLNGDRLMPHDPHERHRSVSSLSRYPTPARSRDPLVERYLMNNGGGNGSLGSTGTPSTTNLHSHRHHTHPQHGRRLSNDMTAAEALRAKAGSRATYRTRDDTWSAHETEISQDGHNRNYLAPLPPFQSGPAYTRVPKRKYCKWFCGGCRWWVLLLCIVIPAGILALAAAFFWQRFQVCEPIDPDSVAPMVYMVDPTNIQGIALEYQTKTSGSIRIVDSPDPNENKVIMRLQRQFHKMENREDLAGFHTENLPNGYSRYVLDDAADNHRGFLVASVLCSTSILTIEMPRTLPGRAEIALDALIDQQDLTIDLDENLVRNTTWRIRTLSNKDVVVKSLNINTLTISSTSKIPSSIVLESVIVRDQLSVVSVSGNIQAAVGFDHSPEPAHTTPSTTSPQPTSTSSPSPASAMVNLNTLDGEIRFDLKAWNQTCTFKVDSSAIQVTKAGAVVLDFTNSTTGGGGRTQNQTHIDHNGLVMDLGALQHHDNDDSDDNKRLEYQDLYLFKTYSDDNNNCDANSHGSAWTTIGRRGVSGPGTIARASQPESDPQLSVNI